MSNVLVVYYSRSGNTKEVAEAIASVAGWDLERIEDVRSRRGLLGYLRSGWEASFRRSAAIRPTRLDPSRYDLVVIGTPVWNASLASPVRAWMAQHALPRVAFFCTLGGRGARRVFDQMAAIGGPPLATLDLTQAELERVELPARVGRFVSVLSELVRRARHAEEHHVNV